MDAIVEMVGAVSTRARDLHDARHAGSRSVGPPQCVGLDYYNHNIDTSARYYPQVTSTDVCRSSRHAGECPAIHSMKVCCGGIGMGEEETDRVRNAGHACQPRQAAGKRSIASRFRSPAPLRQKLYRSRRGFIRIVAPLARIMMPKSYIHRLSGGPLDRDRSMSRRLLRLGELDEVPCRPPAVKAK